MWWTGGALGFDFETDGRDPTDARIITCGMVNLARSGGSAVTQEMEILLQPEREIDPGAVAVHGITTERAREEGQLREAGIAQIVTTVAELAGEQRPMVGHNLSYDLTVLDREMRRTEIGLLSTDIDTGFVSLSAGGKQIARFPVIDTMVLDKAVDRYRPGKRQLSFVAAHYGVPMAEGAAHGATADSIAALRIAIVIAGRTQWSMDDLIACYRDRKRPAEIARMLQWLGTLSLEGLHEEQRGWAAEQAEGLRDHFMRNPDKGDAATVDGSWPLRPVPAVETVTIELI